MKYYLHLAEGYTIEAENSGYEKEVSGEVVFTTAMTGYVEALTDPSFAGQIVVFTYPLLGNYGVPKPEWVQKNLLKNFESERIWAAAIVVSLVEENPAQHESYQSLTSWCRQQRIPLLTGVDTRALTLRLREHGVLSGKISQKKSSKKITSQKYDYTIVSTQKTIKYVPKKPSKKTIAVIDCGVKHGILRALLTNEYEVIRVPWNVNPLSLKIKINGVVISNGPGDPKDWQETISIIKQLVKHQMPLLGICLGHQLLALAIGADTYKLKYGHRGLNQPCQDVTNKKCYVTSQNHGYAVAQKTIPKEFQQWFVNLNDGTNEGIRNLKKQIWSVQFHPEGSPGPFDTHWIFSLL